jgi:methylated-DNA-[protein]-cysteine S-methyltransferase
MLNVGTIQVASNRWIGTAIDAGDGRLVACTTPTSSTQAAKADVLESVRRFGWPAEQVTFRATDSIMSAAHRLWELFQGRGTPFRLEEISLVRWTHARIEVSRQLLQVPKGRAISYGNLARRAGSSPRGVGMVMATNPVPLAVPCHRVIHADGRLGRFGRTTAGTKVKAAILLAEGVPFTDEERIASSILVS